MNTKLDALLERGLGRTAKVRSEHSADHVIRAMAKDDVSTALVLNDDNEVVGVITERELVRRVLREGRRASAVTCEHVMCTPVVAIGVGATIRDALQTMATKQSRCLVVIGPEGTLGVITERDLWMFAAHDLEHEVDALTDYICGRPSSVPPPPAVVVEYEEEIVVAR